MNKYIELEYKTMREEVKMTFNHIFLTMQMSLAFISGLLIVAFNNLSNILLANMILCILVPMVCATALSFMLSESIRMQRAGIYMCILEKNVLFILVSKLNPLLFHFIMWNKNILEFQLILI